VIKLKNRCRLDRLAIWLNQIGKDEREDEQAPQNNTIHCHSSGVISYNHPLS
jgi:hypothetical protein